MLPQINRGRFFSPISPDVYGCPPKNAQGKVSQLFPIDAGSCDQVVSDELRTAPGRCACPESIEQWKFLARPIEHLGHNVILTVLAEKLLAIATKHEVSDLA